MASGLTSKCSNYLEACLPMSREKRSSRLFRIHMGFLLILLRDILRPSGLTKHAKGMVELPLVHSCS